MKQQYTLRLAKKAMHVRPLNGIQKEEDKFRQPNVMCDIVTNRDTIHKKKKKSKYYRISSRIRVELQP